MKTHEGMRRRFAASTAAMTLLLILAGGLVTTTATGDSIPEWPLLWGRLGGGFLVEWSHRALAMVVALMVTVLAAWTHRVESRPWVRQLAWLAFAGVLVQALLGGLRIYVPRAAVSIVHACFAQVVFCAVTMIAVALTRMWAETRPDAESASARRAGGIATGAAFLQLVAGAVTRHTGGGLMVHVVGAVAVLLAVSMFASGLMMSPLRRGGLLLTALLGLQIILGLVSWSIRSSGFVRSHESPVVPILTVTSHVAVGAALLAATLVLTLRCHRASTAPASLEVAPS